MTESIDTTIPGMEATPETLIDPRWSGRRVAVAMSGGVDSSVAAALCVRAGCDVIGITMKLWEYDAVGGDEKRDGRCCTIEAFNNCRAVAAQYDFPHYLFDFTGCFEDTVIRNFVEEYRRGRTPNPCALCNLEVKWGTLWNKAMELGCEALVTGHYARLETDAGETRLLRGCDHSRDQTYFLWRIPTERLAHTIFPLGVLTKDHVRRMAAQFDLTTAATPESRDICFVDDGKLSRFMSERAERDRIATSSGSIVNRHGDTLGRHDGYEHFTIGQRRGLGVAIGRPQYVTTINAETATVTIGDNSELYHRECRLSTVNWLLPMPHTPREFQVQIRYRHNAARAVVTIIDAGDVKLRFDDPQRAITPGQSAVFYDGDRLAGGGIVDSVGPM